MSLQTDDLLIVQLVNFLNANSHKIPLPGPIFSETDESGGNRIWIEALPGPRKTLTYVTGDFEARLPFAVYYQETNPQNPADLDLPLWNLADFFSKHPETPFQGFAKVKIEMTDNPAPFRRDGSRISINRAVYNLTYIKEINKE